MPKFRKKPVVIEAVRWFPFEDWNPMTHFMGGRIIVEPDNRLVIETLEGTMRADPEDWVIKGVMGEFYPCKPDIFEATYEKVE